MAVIFVRPAAGDEILVPSDYPTIQSGIDAATPGDTVLVSAGRYVELIEMKGGVSLRSESGLADCVTIDGDGLSGVVRFVSLSGTCLLEGFTITGGIHYGLYFLDSEAEVRNCLITGNWAGANGGGVYCRDATLSFQECTLSDNISWYHGGGLYATGESSLEMINCRIADNRAWDNGGGLAAACPGTFVDCVIENNWAADHGGGVWAMESHLYSNCRIMNNEVSGFGGGVFVAGPQINTTEQKFEGCVISGNTSGSGHGGGLAIEGAPLLDGCRIWGNFVLDGSGGGIFCSGSPKIVECLIVDNSAGKSGGGMFCTSNDSMEVAGCTIVGNSAAWEGGGVYCQSSNLDLTQSIIAFSEDGEGMYCYGDDTGVLVGLCDIFGNEGGDQLSGVDMGGNFSADPLFCDPVSGNLFLDQGSPCLMGADPYYFVIGAQGLGDCSIAQVEDPPLPELAATEILGQNHPNPFNPRTTIPFRLDAPGNPVIRIFDLGGRQVKTLLYGERFGAGPGEAVWNGRDDEGRAVPSGIYFYRLDVGAVSRTKRMVLMK